MYCLGLDADVFWEIACEYCKNNLGAKWTEENSRSFIWKQIADHFVVVANDEKASVDNITPPNAPLRITVPKERRIFFYTDGLYLKLSDPQVRALELVAHSKRCGITQIEAARQMSTDPRNLFYQLKLLFACRLITKTPVTQQRAFTYLLHLSRYAPTDDFDILEQPTEQVSSSMETRAHLTSPYIRHRIMELLLAAPQKTLSAADIYRLTGADGRTIKLYRKNISWLTVNGFIECFMANELGGVAGKILKYKRHLPDAVKHKDRTIKELARPVTNPGSAINRGACLERQVHDYIDSRGKDGATITEIMRDFALGRKIAYRICDRLANGKIFANSDVIKIAEFHGKERRLRFFTNKGRQANNKVDENDDVQIIPSGVRDSVNRIKRLKTLLEIVSEAQIIDAGKNLTVELQKRLDEQSFRMDNKTLRRLIVQLEEANEIRSAVVALPNGINRTIIMKSNLSLDDEIVKRYIDSLKQSRAELHRADVPSFTAQQMASQQNDQPQTTTAIIQSVGKPHKIQMQKQGFVHGIMARCRILHTHLIRNVILPRGNLEMDETWLCETLPTFFRNLPLALFLKLVGVAEMTSELRAFIRQMDVPTGELGLDQLPPNIKLELHRRRVDSHKTVLKRLMELLCQLGLATVDNRYPSVAFRLPYQYRLSRVGIVLDISSGTVVRSIDLVDNNGLDDFWGWLSSLESLTMAETLPEVYEIALDKQNWLAIAHNRKLLRQSIFKILRHQRSDSISHDEVERELSDLATEFRVEIGVVKSSYETMMKNVQQRESQRRQALFARQQRRQEQRRQRHTGDFDNTPRAIFPREHVGGTHIDLSDEESREPREFTYRKTLLPSYTEAEVAIMKLASVLLYRPELRSPLGNIQWIMIEALVKAGYLPEKRPMEDVRQMLNRSASSYEYYKMLRSIEENIAWLSAAAKAGHIDAEPQYENGQEQEEYFLNLFKWYHDKIENLPRIDQCIREKARHQSIYSLSKAPLLIPVDNKTNLTDWNWRRLSRLHQFFYFQDLPFHVSTADSFVNSSFSLYEHEIEVLKKALFTIPIEKYDSAIAQKQLENLDSTRMEKALDEMASMGLISKNATKEYIRRTPGSEYFVHQVFNDIADGCAKIEDQVSDERDIVSLLNQVSFGNAELQFSIENKIKPRIIQRGSHKDQHLEEVIEHYSSSTTADQRPIWFNLQGDFRPNTLKAALRLVLSLVKNIPGISFNSLVKDSRPHLTPFEIQTCVALLVEAQLIVAEDGISSYYIK